MSDVSGRFCRGTTKDGRSCKAPATEGGYCFFHAHPDQARILGQKGGRKNRYQVTNLTVPDTVTSASLATILDRALEELLSGRLEPRVAAALSQLVNTRRRLMETVELERRVAELEQAPQRELAEHRGPSLAREEMLSNSEEPPEEHGGDNFEA